MKVRVAVYPLYEKWYQEYYGENFISFDWIERYVAKLKFKDHFGNVNELEIYEDLDQAPIIEIDSELLYA